MPLASLATPDTAEEASANDNTAGTTSNTTTRTQHPRTHLR
jgi:hypothetical protein